MKLHNLSIIYYCITVIIIQYIYVIASNTATKISKTRKVISVPGKLEIINDSHPAVIVLSPGSSHQDAGCSSSTNPKLSF
jgi:hypothetical protein